MTLCGMAGVEVAGIDPLPSTREGGKGFRDASARAGSAADFTVGFDS